MPDQAPPEFPPFEKALGDLERILRSLEDGTTTLEDALGLYERGVGLLKHCYKQLRDAEQKIMVVSGADADGRPTLRPFDHAPSDGPPPPPRLRPAGP